MFENYTYLRFDKTNVLRQGVLTPCEIKKLKLPNRSIMKIKLINFSKILFIIIMYNDKFLWFRNFLNDSVDIDLWCNEFYKSL